MENKITKIAIFDVDGTLIDSPIPKKGVKEYKDKTGKDWPYEGWWSKKESLDLNIFDIKPFYDVIKHHKRCSDDSETIVVMMTGRLERLSEQVNKILEKYNLHFDLKIFNRGGATLDSKLNSIDDLLSKFTDIVQIEIFEDRPEHAIEFMKLSQKYPSLDISIFLVNQKHKLENEK